MNQFIDQVRIKIRSGDGGNGMVAWRREKYEPMGGPAGGSGGNGGDVYLIADANIRTLIDFRYRSLFEAEPGVKGGPKNLFGRAGKDLYIKVPPGTVIRDLKTGNVIADLTEAGQSVKIAEGGRGGRGNTQMASPTKRSPSFCEPGKPGVERNIELELKLLADVGLVGLPNAGKSTLLSVMTSAKPKIADYPFSTLVPGLGVVNLSSDGGGGYVLADIPGLIHGASEGVGLGHKFLKHIERTRIIVHLADISQESLEENIKTINEELHLYSQKLDQLPQILVLNKVDLLEEAEKKRIVESIRKKLPELLPQASSEKSIEILAISCATKEGLDALNNSLMEKLSKLTDQPALHTVAEDVGVSEEPDQGFTVTRRKNVFTVMGDRVERMVSVTNLKDPESLYHLFQVLKAMGVIDALVKEGAQPGSDVMLGKTSFEFGNEHM